MRSVIKRVYKLTKKSAKGKAEPVKHGNLQVIKYDDQRLDTFDLDGRYVWDFETGFIRPQTFTILASVAVIGITCFPIWPIWMRIAVWYLSVTILIAIFGLLAIRYLIFGLMWTLGLNVWLFPHLLDDNTGFVGSFKPVFDTEQAAAGQRWLRLIILGCIGGAVYWAYMKPTEAQLMFDDFIVSQRKLVGDLYEGKLLSDTSGSGDTESDSPSATSTANKAYKPLDEILQDTDEAVDVSAKGEPSPSEEQEEYDDLMHEMRAEAAADEGYD